MDLLPSVTTNSDPGTESPASDSTTLTTSADPKPTPQSSTPKPSVTSPTSPPQAMAPLVDLSETPSKQTSKSLDDSSPAEVARADGQSLAEQAKAPQSKDSQIQAGAHQTTDSDPAKNSSDSSSAPSAPNQDEYGHL